jgi:hypothetical protein
MTLRKTGLDLYNFVRIKAKLFETEWQFKAAIHAVYGTEHRL